MISLSAFVGWWYFLTHQCTGAQERSCAFPFRVYHTSITSAYSWTSTRNSQRDFLNWRDFSRGKREGKIDQAKGEASTSQFIPRSDQNASTLWMPLKCKWQESVPPAVTTSNLRLEPVWALSSSLFQGARKFHCLARTTKDGNNQNTVQISLCILVQNFQNRPKLNNGTQEV